MDKANGGPIRKSLTIRETKVQELHSQAPGRQKRKLAEDLRRAARGQATLDMDARTTKVAAEKAVKAALGLGKEKQSTATRSRNSTELKAEGINGGNSCGNLCVELRHR